MVASSFPAALRAVLKFEGGYVNHPKDPGGETNKGVTKAVYDSYRRNRGLSAQSVKNISDAEVAEIYRNQYWNAIKGDQLPAGVDNCIFDGAVNSGPKRAVFWLQHALGVSVDGAIGPRTIAVANAHPDKAALISSIIYQRRQFLRGLRTYPTFGRGWEARIKGVEKQSIAMVYAPAATPEPVAAAPEPVAAPVAQDSNRKGFLANIINLLIVLFSRRN